MLETAAPASVNDDTNRRILAVSEDQLAASTPTRSAKSPVAAASTSTTSSSGCAPCWAGTIRRVRQTLLSHDLAAGALVAWKVPPERLEPPSTTCSPTTRSPATSSSAHRRATPGARLPPVDDAQGAAGLLAAKALRATSPSACGAERSASCRRRRCSPSASATRGGARWSPAARSDEPRRSSTRRSVELTDSSGACSTALKREFGPTRCSNDIWSPRAAEAGLTLDDILRDRRGAGRAGLIGRFSTFLEHSSRCSDGRARHPLQRSLPLGRAGGPRDGGRPRGRPPRHPHARLLARRRAPSSRNVNIMGVPHGTEKERCWRTRPPSMPTSPTAGIPVSYTNVFWGGRSEIKPSELCRHDYAEWCRANGIDPASMKEGARCSTGRSAARQ